MKKIVLLIILLSLIPVANAETGNLIIAAGSGLGYTQAHIGFTNGNTFNWSRMIFDTADYTNVSSIHIVFNSDWSFATEGRSTTFTIVNGGVGSGTATYTKSTRTVDIYFEGDTPYGAAITSSPVSLQYASNILNDVTFDVQRTYSLAWDTPITFAGVTDGTSASACPGGVATRNCVFTVQVYTYIPNTYNVTYSEVAGGVVANVSIDKTMTTANTKISILNSTQTRFVESAFNSDSFSYSLLYNTGLYLNATTSTGLYDFVTVNSTGAPVPPGQAGTNQTNITKPSTGVNIVFDKSSYFVGDNVNITYWFSDTEWNALGAKYMNIYLNDALQEDISGAFKHGLNSQKGYYIYSATASGTLKAEVVREILFISKNTWDASVEILPPGNSWISLSNSTSYAKVPLNVTYHMGYSVQTYPPAAIEIQTIDSVTGNKVDNVFPVTFPDGTIPIGVIHPIPEGKYSIRLYDVVKDSVLDVKTLTVVLQPAAVPTLGISTSSISTDKSTYFYNDYMQVTFQVDDANFSNYSIRGEIVDLNKSIVTKRIYAPFADQVGTYTTIVNIDKKQKCENGLNCWFNTGNNSINIVAYNATASFTIAYANFTVSSTTSDGYGLQVSTITPSANVPFQVTTIVPALHTGLLVVANDGYKKIVYSINQTVASGTNTIPATITPVNNNGIAYYVAELWGDDGLLKVKIPLTVSQPVVTTTTVTSSGTALQVTGFLSSNIFWALVFVIGFMLAIAVYERKGK